MIPSAVKPLVTVLIPAYNAGPYLRDTLVSVQQQGIDDLEILVIDDGSTDETGRVLAGFDDPRLRVVQQSNLGLVGALNRGLDEARGSFLARLDADDEMPVGRLVAQLTAMERDPELLVLGTDYEAYGDASFRVRMPGSDRACRQRLVFGSCHCGASVMIRRDRLAATGLRFDPAYRHAEDYRMWCELSEYGRLGNLPMVGYRYRIHAGQVSSLFVDEQRATHLRIAAEHASRTGRRPIAEADLRALLWPSPPSRPGAVAAGRSLLSLTGPLVRAGRSAPSVEGLRFLGRKAYEAAAGALR